MGFVARDDIIGGELMAQPGTSSLSTTTPLEGAPSLLPLARGLLDALGLGGFELPTEEAFARPLRLSRELGEVRISIERRSLTVDPYAGGASDEQTLRVEGAPPGRLRVSIAEIAWVGQELEVAARGSPEWVSAIAAVVEAFVAQHERRPAKDPG